jgi:hypothetical protein
MRLRPLNRVYGTAPVKCVAIPKKAVRLGSGDVKARLSAIDGTEALVEGFGASSGWAARTL